MPFFLSFFIGLRRMANVPVDSLRTGGTMWFPDLTVPDEYYLLPLLTSLTLGATIEVRIYSKTFVFKSSPLLRIYYVVCTHIHKFLNLNPIQHVIIFMKITQSSI